MVLTPFRESGLLPPCFGCPQATTERSCFLGREAALNPTLNPVSLKPSTL